MAKVKPGEHRAEYRNLRPLRRRRYRRRAADLRNIDGTAEHRLDRPRTADIDKLGFVGAVFLEQFQFMGDPERRIGIGEGAKGEAKLLRLCRFKY